MAQIYVRKGGGGRKEAGKEGGKGNIKGELGNRNRCHRHAAEERGRGRGRGRSVEMEKHSFSQKEEGREEAFNDGQNKRSTNLLDRQTIF